MSQMDFWVRGAAVRVLLMFAQKIKATRVCSAAVEYEQL